MGNFGGGGLADNVEVTHQSGASRLMNSVLTAVCLAPIALIGGTVLLGWNEQRAVCDSKAIVAGRDKVLEVGCTSPSSGDGTLVMFSCNFARDGLSPFAVQGDFAALGYSGTGLKVESQMLQCVESKSSSTTKNSVGGGTTTVTTYTYSVQWSSSWVDSSTFAKKNSDEWRLNCGMENPPWPANVPQSRSLYAPSLAVGAFRVGQDYITSIPLSTPVLAPTVPAGWTSSGTGYTSSRWEVGNKGIGRVQVSFLGTDWSNTLVTVLGENRAGAIGRWTAPSSWLCSGFTLGTLVMGQVSRDALFDGLQAQANAVTWVLRFVGFVIAWLAFCCCFKPLEVAADCVPCIGPCLGDSIAAITSCIACIPATACTLGVIGVVWIAMRPAVGVTLFVVFFVVSCGMAGTMWYLRQKKVQGQGQGQGQKKEPVGEPVVMGRYVVSE